MAASQGFSAFEIRSRELCTRLAHDVRQMHVTKKPFVITDDQLRELTKEDLARLRSYITSELGVLTPRGKKHMAVPGPGAYDVKKVSLPSPRCVPQFTKPMDKWTDDHKFLKLSQAAQHSGLAEPGGRAAGMGARDTREMGPGTRLPNVGPGSYTPEDPKAKPAVLFPSLKFKNKREQAIPDKEVYGEPGPGAYECPTAFHKKHKASNMMTPATATKPRYPAVGPGEYETMQVSLKNMSPSRGYADAAFRS